MWVERLTREHDREGFTCGRTELDDWLRTKARQAQDRHESSTTFVLTDDGTSILGYFAVSAHTVTVQQAPEELVRGHAAHLSVPAILLARLAISRHRQGERLGERLLKTVVLHTIRAQELMPVRLLVVDAIGDQAAAFYERYGFVRWPTDELRLFARIKDIRETLGLPPPS